MVRAGLEVRISRLQVRHPNRSAMLPPNRCGSEAVVCGMRFYACWLWHLFHHVVERVYAKRWAAKPDSVICGIELLALTFWHWIEKAQGVFWAFLLNIFQIRGWKISWHQIYLQDLQKPPCWICFLDAFFYPQNLASREGITAGNWELVNQSKS